MKTLFALFAQSTFWVWNFLFLYVVYLGMLPLVGWPLMRAIALGQVPWAFALSLGLLLLVPLASVGLGIRFLKQPHKILQVFYGFELPLFLLSGVRLFALRDVSGAGSFVLASLLLSIVALTFYLVWGYGGDETLGKIFPPGVCRAIAHAQTILHSVMLLMGIYGGTILLFYVVPTTSAMVVGFLSFGWVDDFFRAVWDSIRYGYALMWVPLGLALFWLSASVFVTAPVLLIALYVRQGQAVIRRWGEQFGRKRAIALSLTTLSTWLMILGLLNQQPQARAFALLDQPSTTPQAQQALLAKSDTIRKGLLNAYLADYRYVSAIADNNHIQALYQKTFPILGNEVPQTLQHLYNGLLSPFLYQNVGQNVSDNIGENDAKQAAKRYQNFFDQPIQKAESKAIRRALNATANRDEAKAGLLNVDQHKVLLAQQNITVHEHGDWAEVELHETYKNQTNDVQEVYYSFSLPESAVLTGVWLGDTGDRSQRFLPQVSPRGAAQKVYNTQVQRVNPIDPALLEQVGPRHYRLRAFPVPPQVPQWAATDTRLADNPTEMHLWLTYQVMQTEQGWPLPQLGEQRNIFWNGKTERRVNDQAPQQTIAAEQWLPNFIAAQTQVQPALHTAIVDGYRIEAQPLRETDYVLPKHQQFAIILDGSRSMTQHRGELNQTFAWLKQNGFADSRVDNNDADLFITAPARLPGQSNRKSIRSSDTRLGQRLDDLHDFDPARFTFFGSLQLQEMLQQFDQLKGDTPYDGILVLTDGDTYELSKDGGTIPALQAPLWMVHLGKLPPAYDDGVLQAIQQSGGGVEQAIAPALQRAATQTKLGPNVSVRDGYAWRATAVAAADSAAKATSTKATSTKATSTKATLTPTPTEDGFKPLAVRRLIEQLSHAGGAGLDAGKLDKIHAIAKREQIVTPYSSMIVLVNDEQRRMLATAEAAADRFDRKVESGSETLEKPFNPLSSTTSIPEASPLTPVLTAGAAFLLLRRRSRRI